METKHYRIEKEDLNPTRFNLFNWTDKVGLRVRECGEEYEKKFYENPQTKRELEKNLLIMTLYELSTLPLSIPSEIIRKFYGFRNKNFNKSENYSSNNFH